MRVIAGTYRSRRLRTLRGLALRPTSDRLRETLFNILGADVQDSVFVDLFAGSGAVGIEALSRGARRSVFVEHHPAAVKLLRANLESLGIAVSGPRAKAFAGSAEVIALDAVAGLEQLAARGLRADFVFADPPYADSGAYSEVLNWLGDSKLLALGGRVILEHSRRQALPAVAGQLERGRMVQQGDAVLSFYAVVRAA
jgi:16S rRNA (guanine(966)-N(2))-methyltransferase RsmD